VAALEEMGAPAMGPYLLSLSMGERPATPGSISDALDEVVVAMVEAGEVREAFTPGDLRRTVETRLAAAGISGEIRAHLQSHGLHGVQHKHYNMHDYAAEKRMALEMVLRLASGETRPASTKNARTNSRAGSQRMAAAEALLDAMPKPSKRGVSAAQLKAAIEEGRR
jgi:hypothetical protein